MDVIGCNLIGGECSCEGDVPFFAQNPATVEPLPPEFREATANEVDRALLAAERAFRSYAYSSPQRRAAFLRAIADEIVGLGAALIDRANAETALPHARLEGERVRTIAQLRLFADYIEEGSWVAARIDTGDTGRHPIPKPDLRRMLIPLGPVVVFGASNFPLAFSAAGGDTASALAAGCSVVFKAHPAHPGTCEMTARAIQRAARSADVPSGVFSLLHGWSHAVGLSLVRHPLTQAVGFTGSLRGGRALFDAAAARAVPIPVYAEMGSINPVFLLPSAAAEHADAIVHGLAGAVTMGVGQFCTNPGVVVGVRGEAFDRVADLLAERISATDAGVMLYEQLAFGYTSAVTRARALGAEVLTSAALTETPPRARATLLRVDASHFVADATLRDEMFGPVSVLVVANDVAEMELVAMAMEGQLTATIHGTPAELIEHARLVHLLERKVGRLLFNGYPTGVEVGHAMQHGGPFPAASDSRSTSVGTAAITRFARPLCYQNFPQASLPLPLGDENELGIWRLVNGAMSRDAIS